MHNTHPFLKRTVGSVVIGLIFFTLPILADYGVNSIKRVYFRNADVVTFLEVEYIQASDVCLGETEQTWEGKRFVYGEGLPASIVRELFKVTSNGDVKVYDEAASVFIEPTPDGISSRTAALPILKEGTYYWSLSYTALVLPANVIRHDVPTTKTNLFTVSSCPAL